MMWCSWAFVAHVSPQFWCDVTLHVSPDVYDNVPLFFFIFVRRANRWREGSLIFFLSYDFTVIKCMISGHKQTLWMKRSSVLNMKHKEQDCDCGSLYILQLWDRFVGVNPAAFSLFRLEKIFIDCVTLCFLVHFFVTKLHRLKACVVLPSPSADGKLCGGSASVMLISSGHEMNKFFLRCFIMLMFAFYCTCLCCLVSLCSFCRCCLTLIFMCLVMFHCC